jgi:hypothetical protein
MFVVESFGHLHLATEFIFVITIIIVFGYTSVCAVALSFYTLPPLLQSSYSISQGRYVIRKFVLILTQTVSSDGGHRSINRY